MRRTTAGLFTLLAAALPLMPAPATAQMATLTGRVTDSETRQPISTVLIHLQGGPTTANTLSNQQGQYSFSVSSGTYALVVGERASVGYAAARFEGVSVAPGETRTVDIALRSMALTLTEIVVTGTPQSMKDIDAPNNVQTVGEELIQGRAAVTPLEHIRHLPGMDVAPTGIAQANAASRGFNNVFSGSLMLITDYRYASVPSLRLNAYNMIPLTSFDTERIEVLLGPASALYGPNSASGVLHMLSSSPIDRPGTAASVAGGERSLFHTQFRHATRFSERSGLKVSGQYFRAQDWNADDPAEMLPRDFQNERFGGEARFDTRPWDDGEVVVSAGVNQIANSVELTGIGAAQGRNWMYSYLQARLRKDRFFTQAFLNQSDAGETVMLRTGQDIVDESRMMVGQLQHGARFSSRLDLVYGLDLQYTQPRTKGTITGRNEDDDDITEVGGYLHGTVTITPRVDLVAAMRADHHDRLEDVVFSPRAAVLYRPGENQTFRATFNRAFNTPTTNNLFLDIVAGRIPIPPPPGTELFGFDVRTQGVPRGGYTFNDTCPGGFQDRCMVSPLNPGTRMPATAAPFWNQLVQGAVPPDLLALLLNPGQPGDPSLASMLRRFDQEARDFLADLDGPRDIDRLRPTITNTFEVGHKGILGGRLLLAADLYRTRINDFVGPLRVETPSVFLDPASVQAFVLHRLQSVISSGAVSPEDVTQIVTGLSSIPLGTVAPDGSTSSDLVLTYRNFGDVDLWGTDLAFQYLATDRLSLFGSVSLVSQDCFVFSGNGTGCSGALDIALNAPRRKGSAGARWSDAVRGVSVDGQLRVTEAFPMNSGVFVGQVDRNTVLDANASYRLPRIRGASATVTVTNVLDRRHRHFVGAPEIGRLGVARLTYRF